MSDDIVARLRIEGSLNDYYDVPALQREAADEIERLRAELASAIGRMKLYENDDSHASVTRALGRSNAWRERAEAAERERDVLRALLRDLRPWIKLDSLITRIDAALNKGGRDE